MQNNGVQQTVHGQIVPGSSGGTAGSSNTAIVASGTDRSRPIVMSRVPSSHAISDVSSVNSSTLPSGTNPCLNSVNMSKPLPHPTNCTLGENNTPAGAGHGSYVRSIQDSRGVQVQAVSPFGIRESVQLIPQHCIADSQVLKHLARELGVAANDECAPPPFNNNARSMSGLVMNSLSAVSVSKSGFMELNQLSSVHDKKFRSCEPTKEQCIELHNQNVNFPQLVISDQPPPTVSNQMPQDLVSMPDSDIRLGGGGFRHLPPNYLNDSSSKVSVSHPELSRFPADISTPEGHANLAVHAPSYFASTSMQDREQSIRNHDFRAGDPNGGAANGLRSPARDSHQMHQLSLPPAHSVDLHRRAVASCGHSHVGSTTGETISLSQSVTQAELEARVTARMLNLLTEENKRLRTDLDMYIRKTFKLQQLELQYQKVQREYEELVRRQEKREQLETQMKTKLHEELSWLRDRNGELREQLEMVIMQLNRREVEESDDSELRHQLEQRDTVIAQLLSHKKELLAFKERQEIELQAQRSTLEEQRTHIQILDKALNNAQEKVVKLEEECKRRQAQSDRVEQLQKSLQELQEAMRKREDSFKLTRAQLEKELAQLHLQKMKEGNVVPKKQLTRSGGIQDADETVLKLKRELDEKDEKLLAEQRESFRWQQLYYEEMKGRENAVERASEPKNAKIRALEDHSSHTEKLVVDARNESKRYLEELRNSNVKLLDMESRLRTLEAKITEKDALIKILRRQQADRTDPPLTSELWSSDSYGSLDKSRARLEAIKSRLVQSPSSSRFPSIFHSKFSPSVDCSELSVGTYHLDMYKSHHSRAQSVVEPSSYCSEGDNSIPDMRKTDDLQLARYHMNDVTTLPSRQNKNKFVHTGSEPPKSTHRPKSADDHLLTNIDQLDQDLSDGSTVLEKRMTRGLQDGKSETESNAKVSQEQLWQV